MAGIRLLCRIHRQGANGVGKFAAGRHRGLPGHEEGDILPDAPAASNDHLEYGAQA
jgi:hypothetical protein